MTEIAQSQIKRLLTLCPLGVVLLDESNCISFCNSEAEEIFGWQPKSGIGKNFNEVMLNQCADLAENFPKTASSSLPLQGQVTSLKGDIKLVEFFIDYNAPGNKRGLQTAVFINDISNQWLREIHLQRVIEHHIIMNEILAVAIQPPSMDVLQKLLELTVSMPTINVSPRGAIFVLDSSHKNLDLRVHLGLCPKHIAMCRNTSMEKCYCGLKFTENLSGDVRTPLDHTAIEDTPCQKLYPGEIPFLYQISSDTGHLGILLLYRPEQADYQPEEIKTIKSITNILASVFERSVMIREQKDLVHDLISINNELSRKNVLVESVITNLSNGFLLIDEHDLIISCNPEAENLLSKIYSGTLVGKRLEDILGEDASELMSSHKDGLLKRKMNLALRTGENLTIEYVCSTFSSNGNKNGRIICFSDISDSEALLKKMEKLKRLSVISEIALGVAHEVRNPLAGIKAIAQGVESSCEEGVKTKEYMRRIISQVDRVKDLLSEFVTYARPPIPQLAFYQPESLIQKAISVTEPVAARNNIAMVSSFDDNLPLVLIDPNQIQQVLLNVIINAIEALGKNGEIEISAIHIGLAREEYTLQRFPALPGDVPFVVIRISDDGPGINDEMVEKIFDPFFTTKPTGTGLGLSIVMRIVKTHEGYIYAEPKKPNGMNFYIFLKASLMDQTETKEGGCSDDTQGEEKENPGS